MGEVRCLGELARIFSPILTMKTFDQLLDLRKSREVHYPKMFALRLTLEMHEAVQHRAYLEGLSSGELMRRALDIYLAQPVADAAPAHHQDQGGAA